MKAILGSSVRQLEKKANTRDHDQHFSGVMSRGFIDEIEFALWFHFVYIIWLNNLIPKR
jgi:cell division protein FtsB